MDHSILAPSSAERWVHCEGSIALAVLYPEEETDDTREGTAAHWLAEQMVLNPDQAFVKTDWVGRSAPNNVMLDEEMFYGAVMYRDAVFRHTRSDLLVERRVSMPRIHQHAFGTLDTAWIDFTRSIIYLFDYKYGHKPVSAFENWQLIMYLAGLLDEFKLCDLDWRVRFEIVQPRSFQSNPLDSVWEFKASDVRAQVNQLANAAALGLTENARVRSGNHCAHCPARHACPANQKSAGAALDYIAQPVPVNLDANAIALELYYLNRGAKAIESRRSALETEVENRIRKGESIPGYRMEERIGQSRWTVDDKTIISIGKILVQGGVDFSNSDKATTPRQAKFKLKDLGIDESVITPYIERPKSGMKLVEDNGSRIKHLLSQEN